MVETRLICPDRGKTQRRHLGTFTPLCEQMLDMTYDRWRGAEVSGQSADDRARPKHCRRTTPVGWIRQTPNRDWSVALPDRGHMVLGPDKWTVNLHRGEMSFIAYEGTGPNASVKSDGDIPEMVRYIENTVGPMLGATVGEPVKGQGESASAVDWLIPLQAKDGGFAGALRLVAHDGRMFSLTSTGPDDALATEFLESFEIHDAAFAAEAAEGYARYIAAGVEYREQTCACQTVDCARALSQPTPPTLGFPTAEQEEMLTALSSELDECAARLGNAASP